MLLGVPQHIEGRRPTAMLSSHVDLQEVGICAEVHVQSHRAREDQRQ